MPSLALELDAVLVWMVAGYRDWREHGFGEPEQVILATAAYQAESDVLARFIADMCLTGPHFRVRSNELFAAWSRSCAGEGEDAGTQNAFSVALVNRGLDKKKTSVGKIWQGIGLTGDEDE